MQFEPKHGSAPFQSPKTLVVLFALSVLGHSFPALSQQDTPGPTLICAEPVYDFGKAIQTDVIKHDFIIRNEGSDGLVIDKVKSSCGCTTASLPTNYLAAGKEMAISAKVSLKTRKGNLVKTIDVFSNDPLQPVYTLTVKGDVVVPYQLTPPAALMEYSLNNLDDKNNSVRLTFQSDRLIQITGTDTQYLHHASASLDTVITGKEYVVTFSLNEDVLTKDRIAGTFNIMTDSPEAKLISVPYSAARRRDVVVAPRTIAVPATSANGPFSQRLILRHRRAMNTDITEISVPTTNVVATSSRKSKSMHFVKVHFTQVEETLNGTSVGIHVAYEDGKTDVLQVPIEFSEE